MVLDKRQKLWRSQIIGINGDEKIEQIARKKTVMYQKPTW